MLRSQVTLTYLMASNGLIRRQKEFLRNVFSGCEKTVRFMEITLMDNN